MDSTFKVEKMLYEKKRDKKQAILLKLTKWNFTRRVFLKLKVIMNSR